MLVSHVEVVLHLLLMPPLATVLVGIDSFSHQMVHVFAFLDMCTMMKLINVRVKQIAIWIVNHWYVMWHVCLRMHVHVYVHLVIA